MLFTQIPSGVLPSLAAVQMAQIAVIGDWDLSDVRARVQQRMGWSEELADEALREYRKFIALVALNPERSYGVVEAVDEVWHQHLLNTRDYLAMCDAVMGGVIHHEQQPLDTMLGPDYGQLREQTFRDLARMFVGPLSKLWSGSSQGHSAAKNLSGLQGNTRKSASLFLTNKSQQVELGSQTGPSVSDSNDSKSFRIDTKCCSGHIDPFRN